MGEDVVFDEGVAVVTSEGLLLLSGLQMEGRKAVPISDFLLGHPDFVGSHLGR